MAGAGWGWQQQWFCQRASLEMMLWNTWLLSNTDTDTKTNTNTFVCKQAICCASARRKAPASHPSTQKIIPRPFVRSSRIDATRRQYINVLKLKTNCKNVINRITKYYLSVILFFRETFPKACSCGLAKGINRHIFGVNFLVNLWPSEAGRLMWSNNIQMASVESLVTFVAACWIQMELI